jgi:hypothetical protein
LPNFWDRFPECFLAHRKLLYWDELPRECIWGLKLVSQLHQRLFFVLEGCFVEWALVYFVNNINFDFEVHIWAWILSLTKLSSTNGKVYLRILNLDLINDIFNYYSICLGLAWKLASCWSLETELATQIQSWWYTLLEMIREQYIEIHIKE